MISLQYIPQTPGVLVRRLCFADVIMARSGYGYGSFGGMVSSERVESYAWNDESQCTSPVLKCGV